MNNLLIVVDSTFDILTQGLAGNSHAGEIQLVLHLVEQRTHAARQLKISQAVGAIGTDANQQRHLAACLSIDGTAVHIQACLGGNSGDMDNGIGGATDGHADADSIGNGFLRDDITGTDVLLPQVHDVAAGFTAEVDQLAGDSSSGGVAG